MIFRIFRPIRLFSASRRQNSTHRIVKFFGKAEGVYRKTDLVVAGNNLTTQPQELRQALFSAALFSARRSPPQVNQMALALLMKTGSKKIRHCLLTTGFK